MLYILYIIYLNIQYRVRINVPHFTIRDTFKGTCDSKKITNKLRYKKVIGKRTL